MESIIQLGDEEVRLRANAITAFHYKSQFKSDILKDTLSALGGIEAIMQLRGLEKASDYGKLQTMIDGIDTVLIYQLVWSFAKTADKNFIPFYQWIENTDLPPVTELLLEDNFVELLIGNVYRKKVTKTTVEGASDSDDEDMLTTESFFMTCKLVGLTLDDMEYMTIGQCLDYVEEYFRLKSGEKEEATRNAKQSDFDAF